MKEPRSMSRPINFISLGGYRRFCLLWWFDLLEYMTPLQLHTSYSGATRITIHWPGFLRDIYEFWHRGRYGWASRDTWSLDMYLNQVLAGTLAHLADHTNGSPNGYPTGGDDTDHEQWQTDLKRWAKAFSEDPHNVAIYDRPKYVKQWAEEERRRAAIAQALKEMIPWWEALWD